MNNSDKLLNLLLKDSGKTLADLREYPKEAIPAFFSDSLSDMTRLPEDLEIVKFAASESFICFCLAVMPNFSPTKFHCLLADKLQGVYESILNKKESRLMVEVPPRHGKTQLVSILFPAWVLGKTDWPVICASYGSTLAERNSYECRAILDSDIYKYIFPKTKLNPDSTSKEFWRVTSGGSYRAAGVGTGLTGLGGKCLLGDTLIDIKVNGKTSTTRIDRLAHLQGDVDVLSYNHENNRVEWKKILAFAKRKSEDLIKVSTSEGNSFVCTSDHRIFIRNKGYIEARDIQVGDEVLKAGKDMSFVWETKKGSRELPTQHLLYAGKEYSGINILRLLRAVVFEAQIRVGEIFKTWVQRQLLFSRLFKKTPRYQEQQEVLELRKTSIKQKEEILWGNYLQTIQDYQKKITSKKLSVLWSRFSTKIKVYSLLFSTMREQPTQQENDGEQEFKLQTWDGVGQLPKRVLSGSKYNNWIRQKYVRWVFFKRGFSSTSYRPESKKQFIDELGNSVQILPHEASQVKFDTISSLERVRGGENVYDVQVKDNNNLFANKVLVHNCIIIDDPFADRQSADSEQIRESTWRWYLSTLYTRREGKAGLVVLNTRWHEDDLTGRLLDQQKESEESGVKTGGYDKWDRVSFPAIADEDEFIDGKLFRKKGDVLWPEKFSVDDLERIKNNYKQTPGGMYEWSALYQQRPILSENAEFRREWFRYYEDSDLTSLNLYYITLCDLAISQKSSADNTVVRTIAVNRDKFQWFLCDETSGHLDPLQTIDAIFHHRNKYRSKVYIEEVGYQAALQHFVIEEQRKRGEFFTVEGIKQKTTTKKEERIRGLIPLYKAGVVFHKKGQDELLESQLLSFPKSRRDDNMDCLSFALGVAKHTPREAPADTTPNLKLPWWKKKRTSDDFDPREAFSKV